MTTNDLRKMALANRTFVAVKPDQLLALLDVIDAAKAMRESLEESLESDADFEPEWSKHDRKLIAAFNAALTALERGE